MRCEESALEVKVGRWPVIQFGLVPINVHEVNPWKHVDRLFECPHVEYKISFVRFTSTVVFEHNMYVFKARRIEYL